MAETCPSCGNELPPELGQHTTAPLSGLATCPHCGAEVHVSKASTAGEGARSEEARETFTGDEESASFAGHESVEGLKKELEDKP
jgi:hypothetical protein